MLRPAVLLELELAKEAMAGGVVVKGSLSAADWKLLGKVEVTVSKAAPEAVVAAIKKAGG